MMEASTVVKTVVWTDTMMAVPKVGAKVVG